LAANQEISPNYRLIRIKRWEFFSKPRFLRGALRIISYWMGVAKLCREFGPEVVIPTNYDVLPVALYVARRGARILYYCTEYSPTPGWHQLKSGWGLLKTIENRLVQRVHAIVSVEPNRAELQEREWSRKIDFVVLNTPLYEASIDVKSTIAIENRSGGLRLVYAGSIGRRNRLGPLIDAVVSTPKATCDFYGRLTNEYEREFVSMIARVHISSGGRIDYRGTVPYQELSDRLMQYDVGICFYDSDEPNTQFASPAKLFDYMKAGIIILASDQPTPRRIIELSGVGYVVSPNDIRQISELLLYLSENENALVLMRSRSRDSFRARYGYERQAAPVIEWIESVRESV
jgi:glycosyltransferase involved in cell wall biosynthesis